MMKPSAIDKQTEKWMTFVERASHDPTIGFEEQWKKYLELSEARDPILGPMPTWVPDAEDVAASNLGRLGAALGLEGYAAIHRWSVEHRADFWQMVLDQLGIIFDRPPSAILDPTRPATDPRWLPDARLNIVDSCFQADPDAIAVVQGREGAGDTTEFSYRELGQMTAQVASGLAARGFGRGSRVALYMPMTVECVAAYLGVVSVGGAVVSIADSFAPREITRRIDIAAAELVVTVDEFTRGGRRIGLYDKVREATDLPTIVVDGGSSAACRLRAGDIRWKDFLGDPKHETSAAAAPDSVTNILFSSGTTGDPKAIPWTQLTPIKCGMDGRFHQDIGRGSVVCWPTNIGWMMGPWLIYASLLNRGCIALYDGLPTGAGFAEFVDHAGVTVLGVVPSLVRAWREGGACDAADWSRLRVFSSTGEPSNRYDFLWLTSLSQYRAPVIEYCGGTEIGGGYITGTVVQPASPPTFTTPALGLDLVILDAAGQLIDDGAEGEVFLVPPSIGLSQTLLNRDHEAVYHDGCPRGPDGETLRRHGDRLARLPGGFYRAQGRADDTMNLGGIKISSLEIERVADHHPGVSESAAVAVQPDGEGAERLVLYVVPTGKIERDRLLAELRGRIASELNPLFKIHDLVLVDDLPRTASNKLMRRKLRARYGR